MRYRRSGSGYYPIEGEHANSDDLYKGSQAYIHLALEACNTPREEVQAAD